MPIVEQLEIVQVQQRHDQCGPGVVCSRQEFAKLLGVGRVRAMVTGPACPRRPTKRDGRDQRYACLPCQRDFTAASTSIFSGYRWPPAVILAAVRWYVSYPLSARQVTELLAERGVDVSARTVLNWTQTFGPQIAVAARAHRRAPRRRWSVDEVFLFRGEEKRYFSTGPSTSTAR